MTARCRNRTARVFLPLIASATTLIAGPAHPALADTPDNAALLYLRYATLQQSELANETGELALIDWAEDAEHRARLEINVGITEGLIRATKIEHCDFGVEDDTLFFTATMPHLAQMRSAARLLAADARRLTEEDPVAAAERVAAMVRLADHTSDGEVIISSLVGMAIAQFAFGEIERLDERGALTPTAARVIKEALNQIPKNDHWRLAVAMRSERDMSVAMARRHLELMERGERDKASALTKGVPGVHRALASHTPATLEAELTQVKIYYDALLKLWEQPGKIDRFDGLSAAVANGEFGALASIVTPVMWNLEAARLKGEKALTQARATLERAMEPTP
ncbi:MAG: hypothetical protein AAGG07_09930 [Planctomycetota bacterium]